jgi:PAS domain S-box-containing protein
MPSSAPDSARVRERSAESETAGSTPDETGVNQSVPAPRASLIGPLIHADRPVLRYGAAILIVLAIGGLRFALAPIMGSDAPLLPFILAVLGAASLGGIGPALLATVLVPLLVTPLFTGWPNDTLTLAWSAHVAFFLLVSALVAVIMHRLQRTAQGQQAALLSARKSQREASQSEAQLRLIADALPVLISYVDAQHRYRFNNRLYEEWFGLEPEEILGRHVREVLGDAAYAAIRPRIDAALAGGRVDFEAELPYVSGARNVEVHYMPDIGPGNVVRGCFALIEDISERKRAEQALHDAQSSLSMALRAGRAGSFDWDIAGDVNVWSDETLALHGFKPGEFARTREAWLACVHPDDRPGMLQALERALADGEIAVEYRIRVNDTGEVRWIHVRGQVIYDEARRPRRMLGINADITERKQAEEALREADRRKDEFLAMLAHELRNPLAPIRNIAHILKNENLDAATLRRNSELLQRQANQLARLVDDLLDVARITRGTIELQKEPVSIQSILDAALETVQPLFTLKRQTVSTNLGATSLRVEGDPVRLSQAFGNILANAAKYSPDRAMIDVSVEESGDEAIVRVRDEGIGIDPKDLPHIFDLFMQADRSLDRGQGGIGVGLTIVKVLVEMHGGRVEAHSAGLGHGSELTIRLPRLLSTAPLSSPAPVAPRSTVQRRILVVDDNPDSAESLALLLKIAGHETQVAHDGASALAALEHFPPDIVLLDIGLPGMDGYVVARLIRERFPMSSRRLYALTGYGREEDQERALSSGFDGHLTKPVDPERLLRLMSR